VKVLVDHPAIVPAVGEFPYPDVVVANGLMDVVAVEVVV